MMQKVNISGLMGSVGLSVMTGNKVTSANGQMSEFIEPASEEFKFVQPGAKNAKIDGLSMGVSFSQSGAAQLPAWHHKRGVVGATGLPNRVSGYRLGNIREVGLTNVQGLNQDFHNTAQDCYVDLYKTATINGIKTTTRVRRSKVIKCDFREWVQLRSSDTSLINPAQTSFEFVIGNYARGKQYRIGVCAVGVGNVEGPMTWTTYDRPVIPLAGNIVTESSAALTNPVAVTGTPTKGGSLVVASASAALASGAQHKGVMTVSVDTGQAGLLGLRCYVIDRDPNADGGIPNLPYFDLENDGGVMPEKGMMFVIRTRNLTPSADMIGYSNWMDSGQTFGPADYFSLLLPMFAYGSGGNNPRLPIKAENVKWSFVRQSDVPADFDLEGDEFCLQVESLDGTPLGLEGPTNGTPTSGYNFIPIGETRSFDFIMDASVDMAIQFKTSMLIEGTNRNDNSGSLRAFNIGPSHPNRIQFDVTQAQEALAGVNIYFYRLPIPFTAPGQKVWFRRRRVVVVPGSTQYASTFNTDDLPWFPQGAMIRDHTLCKSGAANTYLLPDACKESGKAPNPGDTIHGLLKKLVLSNAILAAAGRTRPMMPWLQPEWYTAPEAKFLADYLLAPVSSGTPGALLRQSQGQIEPWSTVFPKIWIEIGGNESWQQNDRGSFWTLPWDGNQPIYDFGTNADFNMGDFTVTKGGLTGAMAELWAQNFKSSQYFAANVDKITFAHSGWIAADWGTAFARHCPSVQCVMVGDYIQGLDKDNNYGPALRGIDYQFTLGIGEKINVQGGKDRYASLKAMVEARGQQMGVHMRAGVYEGNIGNTNNSEVSGGQARIDQLITMMSRAAGTAMLRDYVECFAVAGGGIWSYFLANRGFNFAFRQENLYGAGVYLPYQLPFLLHEEMGECQIVQDVSLKYTLPDLAFDRPYGSALTYTGVKQTFCHMFKSLDYPGRYAIVAGNSKVNQNALPTSDPMYVANKNNAVKMVFGTGIQHADAVRVYRNLGDQREHNAYHPGNRAVAERLFASSNSAANPNWPNRGTGPGPNAVLLNYEPDVLCKAIDLKAEMVNLGPMNGFDRIELGSRFNLRPEGLWGGESAIIVLDGTS